MEVEAGHDARAARAADRRRHERVLEGGALVHQQRLRLVQSLQQHVGNRAVTIPALDPAPESDFNSFWGLIAILIEDPDPGKSGFVTAISVL